MSAKCRQNCIAGPDTHGQVDLLLEQLPHGLAGGLPRRPASNPFAHLAHFDGVIVSHQLGHGVQESYKFCHICWQAAKVSHFSNEEIRGMRQRCWTPTIRRF